MTIKLLNDSLKIEIFFEKNDKEYEDNICVCVEEFGPEDEKILYAGETNIYINVEQARELARMLTIAADQSNHASR
ncbi:MAG: hypothetical protein Q7J07_04065 [Pelolinea sp.]|nr:hypothetical protein [Pelolinea sp.]